MKFDQEYKNEMDLLSPSEEQTERIKKGVYERLKREDSYPLNAPKPHRKPLKIKIAAISATVCAAALVIVVIGSRGRFDIPLNMTPNFTNNSIKAEGNINYTTDTAPGITAGDSIIYYSTSFFSGSGTAVDTELNGTDSLTDNMTGEAAIGTNASDGSVMPGSASMPPTQNTNPSSTLGISDRPYLSFSHDKKSCIVTLNGKNLTYKKSEMIASGEFDHTDLDLGSFRSADSDLEEMLLVQFDENELFVIYESGEPFGYYRSK